MNFEERLVGALRESIERGLVVAARRGRSAPAVDQPGSRVVIPLDCGKHGKRCGEAHIDDQDRKTVYPDGGQHRFISERRSEWRARRCGCIVTLDSALVQRPRSGKPKRLMLPARAPDSV